VIPERSSVELTDGGVLRADLISDSDVLKRSK